MASIAEVSGQPTSFEGAKFVHLKKFSLNFRGL